MRDWGYDVASYDLRRHIRDRPAQLARQTRRRPLGRTAGLEGHEVIATAAAAARANDQAVGDEAGTHGPLVKQVNLFPKCFAGTRIPERDAVSHAVEQKSPGAGRVTDCVSSFRRHR